MATLPAEIWLQILESTQDIEFLWSSIRPVSRAFKVWAERIILSQHLPSASVSFTLPRHDPVTGALRYRGVIPGSQLSMHYAGAGENDTMVVFKTRKTAGIRSVELWNGAEHLSKRRLEEATMWIWFGPIRAKGIHWDASNRSKTVEWNAEERTWEWTEDWRRLTCAYVSAKAARRRQLYYRGGRGFGTT